MIKSFFQHEQANVALVLALLAPVLLGFFGAGVDYSRYAIYRADIEEIADASALAGAREFLLNKSADQVAKSVAENVADALLKDLEGLSARSAKAKSDAKDGSVRVMIDGAYEPTFLVGMFKRPLTIKVVAAAQVSGAANICVIGLKNGGPDTIKLDDEASVLADNCAIFSNSTNQKGLASKSNASLEAQMICSAGGYEGPAGNFSPVPITDCPARPDPLSGRAEPVSGPCDFNDHEVKDYNGSISPGVYCGGLKIDGSSVVTFEPGIYEIRNGEFLVKDVSEVSGEGVGIFFSSDNATMKLEDSVRVDLAAPVNGAMAGILLWHSASASGSKMFEIYSNFVDRLVGTIYLPEGHLLVGATDQVAEASEYSIIVAEKIELKNNARLVLNTDYNLSPVPVPAGVGNVGGEVYLRE